MSNDPDPATAPRATSPAATTRPRLRHLAWFATAAAVGTVVLGVAGTGSAAPAHLTTDGVTVFDTSTVAATSQSASSPPADSQPPTAPGTPVLTVNGTTLTITWAASTDNVGVYDYLLYDQYTDVIELHVTTTTTYVTTVPAIQHTYFVRARDRYGNLSDPSGSVSIGTPPTCPPLIPCTPTTVPTTPTTPTSPVTATTMRLPVCRVSYVVSSQWTGGFQATITMTNTGGSALAGWNLGWSFANGQTITQMWSATYAQTGAGVTAGNTSWNGAVAPGASVSFGFIGSWTGTNQAPTSFTLNGDTCTAG